jgi:hypothetical protein
VRDEARLAELRRVHDRLHEDLEAIVARDPLVREALQGDGGDLIVAVRSAVVQDVVREAARRYLDDVVVNLGALEATTRGQVERKTLLGRMTVGRWRLGIVVDRLAVRLKAGPPVLRVAGPTKLTLRVPVKATEATGRVSLRLGWDSASVANLVCRDFELARTLDGRTLPQEHTIGATFRVSAGPDSVSLEPLAKDDQIELKVDLTPASWAAVDEALRTQDSLTRCGLLLDRDDVLRRLRALASAGFKVRLPTAMFQHVRLPGVFHHTAVIEGRPLKIVFHARTFEATPALMWSRASVGIQPADVPGTSARTGPTATAQDARLPPH